MSWSYQHEPQPVRESFHKKYHHSINVRTQRYPVGKIKIENSYTGKKHLCYAVLARVALKGPFTLAMDHLHYRLNFDLNKSRQKFHHSLKEHHKISNIPKFRCEMLFVLQTGNWQRQRVLGYQFPPRNAKWLKNSKLRKAILSAFYNISQRNFGILLILWCSFKLTFRCIVHNIFSQ
jgi:hypothetical protein